MSAHAVGLNGGYRASLTVCPVWKSLEGSSCVDIDRTVSRGLRWLHGSAFMPANTNSPGALPSSSTARRWLAGACVLDLAAEVDFPPCLVLRQMLKHLPLSLSKQALLHADRVPLCPIMMCHPTTPPISQCGCLQCSVSYAAICVMSACCGGGAATSQGNVDR